MSVKILWQVHMAAFPISFSVAAERIYSLLTPLNNLESNTCTFFLWAASFQHLANKLVLRGWKIPCMRLRDGGLPLVSYHRFPVTLGGLLHLSFHISSTSLRIIHISLPVFCLSLFLLWDQGCHISLHIQLGWLVLCITYCNTKIANAVPWLVPVNKYPSPSDSVGSSALHWWERHSLHCVNVQNKGWEGIWALYKYNLEVNTRGGKELFLSKRTM